MFRMLLQLWTGLSTLNAGCKTIVSESECISSREGDATNIDYRNNPCHWCCGDFCSTGGKAGLCEPSGVIDMLATRAADAFVSHSKNGLGEDNCPGR